MIGVIKKQIHNTLNVVMMRHLLMMSTSWRLAKLEDISQEDRIKDVLWIDLGDNLDTPTVRKTNGSSRVCKDEDESYSAILIKV